MKIGVSVFLVSRHLGISFGSKHLYAVHAGAYVCIVARISKFFIFHFGKLGCCTIVKLFEKLRVSCLASNLVFSHCLNTQAFSLNSF